jgi:hypothetical protein
MKQLFAIAVLASSILFTSCGGGSLADQVAGCVCGQMTEIAKLKKEMAAATEDKKTEIMAKMGEMKEPACLAALEAKAKALPEADQTKLEADMKAAMEKKCGDAMKSMGGM